jgi:hypothetical protein
MSRANIELTHTTYGDEHLKTQTHLEEINEV